MRSIDASSSTLVSPVVLDPPVDPPDDVSVWPLPPSLLESAAAVVEAVVIDPVESLLVPPSPEVLSAWAWPSSC
ncbi:MAG: hypothetical protein IPH07_35800 [Deltaproteobacteria bacterium]|nr:hypothetical protein [Deltaproteobacteria bacterium]MBK8235551.1 hypothetical protein [Deltaproteobacteria bacterium]MBK8713182.1 hypothetical protein [Deltaproteobacteria bacterium]MBP7286760.1 hypothetical protein [Nannocystaceae bacterium]